MQSRQKLDNSCKGLYPGLIDLFLKICESFNLENISLGYVFGKSFACSNFSLKLTKNMLADIKHTQEKTCIAKFQYNTFKFNKIVIRRLQFFMSTFR